MPSSILVGPAEQGLPKAMQPPTSGALNQKRATKKHCNPSRIP